jgi:uncharacterized membrane protein
MDVGSRQDELPLGRLEAFSDGVFAIAITLLVLELSVGENAGDHLLHSIAHEWPAYLAYITSFLTIGVVWLEHSAVTGALRSADAVLYRINLVVLLLVSFLPFPTKLVSEFIGDRDPERVAVVFYGVVLLALSLAMTAFVRYVAQERTLVHEHIDDATLAAARSLSPSALYVVGIIVGLLLPTVGVAAYLASALYRGLPARTLHRLLWRR